LKTGKKTGSLEAAELEYALVALIKIVQAEAFPKEIKYSSKMKLLKSQINSHRF
jgi:hypothetical protein